MQVGDRLISKINFNDFVEKGREYYITSFSDANFYMDIKRIDNKGGTATILKEFAYNNFDNVTKQEKTNMKNEMNLIEAINYLRLDENNRVVCTSIKWDLVLYRVYNNKLAYRSTFNPEVEKWHYEGKINNINFITNSSFKIYKRHLVRSKINVSKETIGEE